MLGSQHQTTKLFHCTKLLVNGIEKVFEKQFASNLSKAKEDHLSVVCLTAMQMVIMQFVTEQGKVMKWVVYNKNEQTFVT